MGFTGKPVNQAMAKVTVYVDDEVWSKFRASVFHRHGNLKALSREVEGSLRSALEKENVLPYLEELRARLGPRTGRRPVLKGPPAETQIRMMRRRRFENLSGR